MIVRFDGQLARKNGKRCISPAVYGVMICLLLLAQILPCCAISQSELQIRLSSDPVIEELNCESSTLKEVLLGLSRKTGTSLIFDESLPQSRVSEKYTGKRASEIMLSLAQKYHFDLDPITQGTFLVQPIAVPPETEEKSELAKSDRQRDESGAMLNDSLQALATAATSAGGSAVTVSTAGALPLGIPQQTEVAIPPKRVLLEGGIKLSDQLPPIDQSLRAGATITESTIKKLEAIEPDNEWSRIPNWAGGGWKKRAQSNYYHYNYQFKSKDFSVDSFNYRASEGLGYQTDRQGNLWEWDRAHCWTKAETDEAYVLDYHRSLKTTYKDETEFVEHFVSTRVLVDKVNMKVVKSYQTESIQHYTMPEPGVMKVRGSMKTFDDAGQPVSLTKGIAYSKKYRDYRPVFKCRGENVLKLFAQYLRRNGLEHLIPERAMGEG